MAEASSGPESNRGEAEPPRPNPLRPVWLGITGAAGLATSVLIAVATVTILVREPRWFTVAELLPPDESLVGAYIPAAVALGVALILASRLLRIPAAVQLGVDGVSIFSTRSDIGERFGWDALTAVASGSRWEGREVRVRSGKGWFVSLELADAIERRRRSAPDSPADR